MRDFDDFERVQKFFRVVFVLAVILGVALLCFVIWVVVILLRFVGAV